jgi:hypothetical protein
MESIKKPTLLPQQDYEQIEKILQESFRAFEYPNDMVDFISKASAIQARMVYICFDTEYKDKFMFKKVAIRKAHQEEMKSAFRETYFEKLHIFTTALAEEAFLIKYLDFAIGLIKERINQLQTILKNTPKEPNSN